MIRYRDLTPDQRAIVCNGCGPKGAWMPVPEFFLHEICDQHDFNYWIGCSWKDRLKADNQLYTAARKLAGRNPIKQAIALTYYIAVRAGGALCFHYAGRERDEKDLASLFTPLHIVSLEAPGTTTGSGM